MYHCSTIHEHKLGMKELHMKQKDKRNSRMSHAKPSKIPFNNYLDKYVLIYILHFHIDLIQISTLSNFYKTVKQKTANLVKMPLGIRHFGLFRWEN